MNKPLLDAIGDQRLWFYARKTQPIWVQRLGRDESVETLEGTEHASVGDYICRGEAGDRWPQSERSLTASYVLTDEVDRDGWRKCVPDRAAAGVLAAEMPQSFKVETRWGTLSGESGDYLVKRFEDRDVAYPDDVWIVAQRIFHITYQRESSPNSNSAELE